MEFRIDAMLCYENSDAVHIKGSRGFHRTILE